VALPTLLTALLPTLLFAGSAAHAMDSHVPLGTELGREDVPLEVFGFLQPQLDGMLGAPVTGLQAEGLQAFNGEPALFNTVAGGGAWSFRVFRARLGARGSLPGTDQRVSYFTLVEAGEVALTRTAPIVPTDLSLTFSYIPGARVRVGQFKLPVMEEIVPPVAGSMEFVHFSTTLVKLLLENPVEDGVYTGGAHGFRDVGVQVFDGFQRGQVAGAYAVMVSNGAGIMSGDMDDAKDVTGRAEIAWVTAGERHDPRREEVKLGAWRLQGSRALDEERVDRVRQGVFLHVEQGVAWGLVELAQGRGMLEAGRAPPFAGGAVVVVPDGEAWGAVAQAGVRLRPGEGRTELGFKARYDQYHQQTELPEALRIFHTTTLGVELRPVKKLRLQANYELRRLAAPDGTPDAQAIAASMGDRVTLQATARF
jgi:hypothetical protein